MLAGSALILVAVFAVAALALVRPAAMRAFGVRRTLLWGGLVIPAIILTALVAAAFALGERLLAHPREPAPLRIEAMARQWVWQFRYPGGAVTEGRVHMPAGRRFRRHQRRRHPLLLDTAPRRQDRRHPRP
jgi:cytochrome c oxidase subunit 2